MQTFQWHSIAVKITIKVCITMVASVQPRSCFTPPPAPHVPAPSPGLLSDLSEHHSPLLTQSESFSKQCQSWRAFLLPESS